MLLFYSYCISLQVHKIVGFAPILLHVVMSEQFEMPVRQAGKSLCIELLLLFMTENYMIRTYRYSGVVV